MPRKRKVGALLDQEQESVRLRITHARLLQLETDQAANAVDAVGVDNDLWEHSDESDAEGRVLTKRKLSTQSQKKVSVIQSSEVPAARGVKRSKKTLDMILMSEPIPSGKSDSFLSVVAPLASKTANSRPAWKLSSVCSYVSKYRCTSCGSNFCSISCRDTHRATKCIKFAV